jgi:F-type H+-transporting ATPase subunit b
MAIHSMREVIPYAANFSIVVVMLALLLKKPLRKFLYQRHERMKDALESAAIAHKKAAARAEAARRSVQRLAQEEAAILDRERRGAEVERKELLQKAQEESDMVLREADRLSQVEQEDASERVKDRFLELVVRETEDSLRRGLKKDDHSAILKRAQNSIEVGV